MIRKQVHGDRSGRDPALELEEGELLLLVALCHIRRGDPRHLVSAVLEGAALAFRKACPETLPN